MRNTQRLLVKISPLLLVLSMGMLTEAQAGLSDSWNRFREKNIDPVGDALLGPSAREKQIAHERKMAAKQARAQAAKEEANAKLRIERAKQETARVEAEKAKAQAELERLRLEIERLKRQ
jgi:septal ring factor EnvC (AmiA/AmiB activator)